MARGHVAPRARRRRMAFDADGAILGASSSTTCRTSAPTRRPWPVGTRVRRRACCSPGRTGSRGRASPRRRCSPTPRGARRTAGRGSSSRWPARCCSTSPRARSASTRSSCAGATCSATTSCRTRTRNGMPYDDITPTRDVRAGARMLDYDAFRREQAEARAAGRYLGVGTCTYVEPTTTGDGVLRRPRAPRSASSRRARSTCTSPAARRGNSLETTVVQLTADALGVDIDDVAHDPGRHRGDAVRRRDRRQPQRLDDRRRGRRDRGDPPRADRGDRRPPPRGRAEADIELADGRATRPRHAVVAVTLAEIADIAYFRPQELPAGMPAGLEAERPLHTRRAPIIWANATHVCTCEVDVATGCGHAAALHRERGLRADDQPERRRGPDRRRRRCRASAACSWSTSPTTTDGNPLATTFMDYLLPTTTDVPDDRVRPRRDAGAGPRRLQGRRRGRRHRRAAAR